MGKNDAPPTFAELIESAQKLPDPLGTRPADLSSPFAFTPPAPPDTHRLVDIAKNPDKIPGVAEFDYDAHIEHFVIPMQKSEYEKALGLILGGNAILRYEDRTFNKDGDYLIVLCYLTYKRNPEREAARLRREDDEEREELIRRRS
jgi:hypothetical protein